MDRVKVDPVEVRIRVRVRVRVRVSVSVSLNKNNSGAGELTDKYPRPACPLVSSSKTKLCQFSSIKLSSVQLSRYVRAFTIRYNMRYNSLHLCPPLLTQLVDIRMHGSHAT